MKTKTMILGGILVILVAAAGCATTGQEASSARAGLPAQLNELLDSAIGTLRSVSGPDQAMAAHDTLMDVEADLADVVKRAAAAPESTRQELATIAQAAQPQLEAAASQAMGIAGVADVLGPNVANLGTILKQLI